MAAWESVADRIVDDIRPSTILHVGCGTGFLVRALRQRGVDAFGVELSAHTTSDVPPDVQPFCWQQSLARPLPHRYDLIVCTDPLQTLAPSEVERTIETLCRHSDDILFIPRTAAPGDSQPFDLRSPAIWVERFAPHGFCRDVGFASFAGPWTLRVRRTQDTARVLAAYEQRVWQLEQEAQARRQLGRDRSRELMDRGQELVARTRELEAKEETIRALTAQMDDWQARWTDLEKSVGWSLLQKLQYLRSRLAPPGSKRDQLLGDLFHALQTRRGHAILRFGRRVGQEVSWQVRVLLWKARIRASRPMRTRAIQVEEVQARSPVPVHQASVEIIVCIHNALADVQRCLESVGRHTSPPYALILVDDGSDAETQDYLMAFAQAHETSLLRNETPRGYTRAANQGLRHSSADYVVLLNSDTVVTPRWLDRLVACAESAPDIGLVGPLSNTASWQSIPQVEKHGDWAANPLLEGLSVEAMGQLVARYSARLYPTLPFLNGFCLLIRRQVLDQVGIFDEETFGEGYGEEDDLILRARQAGWRAALADDAYVYHAQSRSYSTDRRKRLTERAGPLLVKKHGQRIIQAGVTVCRQDRVLEGIRARSQAMLDREDWISRGQATFAGRRVLFVLTIAEPGGGGNVVIDEAKAMRRMGVEVELFNLEANRPGFERSYPGLDIPVHYGTKTSLATLGSRYDAVVATVNYTVHWLAPMVHQYGRPVRGYYIQGFEPYIYAPGTEEYEIAWNSYSLFPDLIRFTKTEWTRQEVRRQTGVDCSVVHPSINIDLFRPRPRSGPDWPERPLRIAAMVRPSTPYREPKLTMELLQEASQRYGDQVESVIFGVSLDDPSFSGLPQRFAWKLAGMLSQKQVASLLNEVDLFVDVSSHQAMGLTALEAMACGAAVVVPEHGGAVTFARHEENSLVVDTSSRQACWNALQRLIDDQGFRTQIQRQALVDVCAYHPERSAFYILNTLFATGDL